jgi:predicted RNA-binding protein
MTKYWINTISKDHVMRGVEGGFTQANHGAKHNLQRLSKGDWIIFYSPKTAFEGGEPLQVFTAIGQVTDDEPYQFKMSEDFIPFRRNMKFAKAKEAPIRPLIEELEFIKDKTHRGYKFRFGMFEIPEHDFKIIAGAVDVRV